MTSAELTNYGNNLPHLTTPIANNGDKRTLINGGSNNTDTQASIKYGLPTKMGLPLNTTGIPVPRQDLNGIYNLLSKITHYLMAGGRIPYSSTESSSIGGYPNGAEVTYNGHNYKSLADSNTALPTDTSKWACIDYLPLTGGTMSGSIVTSAGYFARRNVNNGGLVLDSGTTTNSSSIDGARLSLIGVNNATNPGSATLTAVHSVGQTKSLHLNPNGSLTWDSKQIVRSVNGINATSDGNVHITPTYTPIVDWEAMATACSTTVNDLKNITVNSAIGLKAYGGDRSGSGFGTGDVYLTRGWDNFDKIAFCLCSDNGYDCAFMTLTKEEMTLLQRGDRWEVSCNNDYWTFYGERSPNIPATRPVSKTALRCVGQNCGLVEIYGVN